MAGEFPHAGTSSGLQLGPARQRNPGDVDGRQPHVDPVTLGFAQLNARFDTMDRRVDNLERRPAPQVESHEPDWDEADHSWEDYRGNGRSGREEYDRPYRQQSRGRGRPNRGGRGDRVGEGVLPGRGSRPGQRRDDAAYRTGRRRDNWDLPQRHEEGDDEGRTRGLLCSVAAEPMGTRNWARGRLRSSQSLRRRSLGRMFCCRIAMLREGDEDERHDEPERDQEEWGLQLDGAEKQSASVLFTG
ncbi:hypothetical protein SASPL_149590 [Salvia splendens]|uniref:Uncharacterized protein n=1 Tax=Salvia splendens TaxID=180675 RepID=A0A8X8Z5D4_SALSN|nr:hypothetical protein SASPL_149590 [Salvia splendens]